MTGVVWITIGVVALGTGGRAVVANTSWRAVEQGQSGHHWRCKADRTTVGDIPDEVSCQNVWNTLAYLELGCVVNAMVRLEVETEASLVFSAVVDIVVAGAEVRVAVVVVISCDVVICRVVLLSLDTL